MNSSAGWILRIRDSVWKYLAPFPRKYREKIVAIIERELPLNPYAGDIEKLEGKEDVWRRRVGAYRIFYEIRPRKRTIYVFRVERRSSKTY